LIFRAVEWADLPLFVSQPLGAVELAFAKKIGFAPKDVES
jgi:hypothetical protein